MSKPSQDTLDSIYSAFESSGYDIRSYSGRGMHGQSCLGVECNHPTRAVIDAIKEYTSKICYSEEMSQGQMADLIEEFCNALRHCNTDSLGLGLILYFPEIPPPPPADDNE